jgi:hypothetical protein
MGETAIMGDGSNGRMAGTAFVDQPMRTALPERKSPGEAQGLHAALADLSRLVFRPGQDGLEDTLTDIAALAVQAVPRADGAGLTLLEAGQAHTIVASAGLEREIEAIQYRLGEGPGITATAQSRTVTSGSLGGDQHWRRFGARAGRLGVHSVMSLPLVGSGGTVVAALNVYAHAKRVFDDRAIAFGELFAVSAAIYVQNAQTLFQARRLIVQLEAELSSRAPIDQAIGILMSRTGASADEAFDKLRVMSQYQHRKLSALALTIRDEAVRRAQARRRTVTPPLTVTANSDQHVYQ